MAHAPTPRIPFAEAVQEPKLLQAHWAAMSVLQQVTLLSFYGCPLETEAQRQAWSVLQRGATYDALGYPTSITPVPYTPQEYNELWACLGRRSGKTDRIAALIVVYEACLGGHETYMRPGRPAICFEIAQDLRLAR